MLVPVLRTLLVALTITVIGLGLYVRRLHRRLVQFERRGGQALAVMDELIRQSEEEEGRPRRRPFRSLALVPVAGAAAVAREHPRAAAAGGAGVIAALTFTGLALLPHGEPVQEAQQESSETTTTAPRPRRRSLAPAPQPAMAVAPSPTVTAPAPSVPPSPTTTTSLRMPASTSTTAPAPATTTTTVVELPVPPGPPGEECKLVRLDLLRVVKLCA